MLIKKKFTRHLILSSIHLITEILSVTIIEAVRIFLTSLTTLQQNLQSINQSLFNKRRQYYLELPYENNQPGRYKKMTQEIAGLVYKKMIKAGFISK